MNWKSFKQYQILPIKYSQYSLILLYTFATFLCDIGVMTMTNTYCELSCLCPLLSQKNLSCHHKVFFNYFIGFTVYSKRHAHTYIQQRMFIMMLQHNHWQHFSGSRMSLLVFFFKVFFWLLLLYLQYCFSFFKIQINIHADSVLPPLVCLVKPQLLSYCLFLWNSLLNEKNIY